jgi:hypothetical protein
VCQAASVPFFIVTNRPLCSTSCIVTLVSNSLIADHTVSVVCSFETLDPFHLVLRREIDRLKNCTRIPDQRETVSLADGTVVEAPLLRWADSTHPSCWSSGSDSNISRDFVVRGVYYPQLVHLLRTVPRVDCVPRLSSCRMARW